MKTHMMSHIKVISSTTYHIVFAKFGELSMELYAIKLAMGSTPVGPPTFNLVSLSSSLTFPNTLPNKELTHGTKRQPCGRHHGVYLIGKPMAQHQKSHLMLSRRLFLLKSGTFSISQGKN